MLFSIWCFQCGAAGALSWRSVCPQPFVSVQRLFAKEVTEVRRGENEAEPNIKLLQNFTQGCEAGRWPGKEPRGFGQHQNKVSAFATYKTQCREPRGREWKSPICSTSQRSQSFRNLHNTNRTQGKAPGPPVLCPGDAELYRSRLLIKVSCHASRALKPFCKIAVSLFLQP